MGAIPDETSLIQTRIPIALATDENYAMPTAVAMTSMLENARISFYFAKSKNKLNQIYSIP